MSLNHPVGKKKKAAFSNSGAGTTGSYQVEECKLVQSYLPVQSSRPSGSRTPYKTRYTESNRRESEDSLKYKGTGEFFLNRTPMAYALKSRTDKWDLIKLQSFYKAKDAVNRTKQQPAAWGKMVVY